MHEDLHTGGVYTHYYVLYNFWTYTREHVQHTNAESREHVQHIDAEPRRGAETAYNAQLTIADVKGACQATRACSNWNRLLFGAKKVGETRIRVRAAVPLGGYECLP